MLRALNGVLVTASNPPSSVGTAAQAAHATFRARCRIGAAMVNASGLTPRSTSFQVTGRAIGKPGLVRGEKAPTAVLPRPLRR